MKFLHTKWAYLIFIIFLILSIITFSYGMEYNLDSVPDRVSLENQSPFVVEVNRSSHMKLYMTPSTEGTLELHMQDIEDPLPRELIYDITTPSGEQFTISFKATLGNTYFYSNTEDAIKEVAKNESVYLMTVNTSFPGVIEVNIEGASSNAFDQMEIAVDNEYPFDIGTDAALIVTLSALFLFLSFLSLFYVNSLHNIEKKRKKDERLRALGIETKEDKLDKLKKLTQTGIRKEIKRDVNIQKPIKLPSHKWYVLGGVLLLFSFVIIVLIIIQLSSGDSFVLQIDDSLPVIAFISFIIGLFMVFNTLSARKNYFSEISRRKQYLLHLHAKAIEENEQYDIQKELNETKEDSE